jgi:hypothetical protein
VHELGHAFAAILSGRVVKGIRIRRDHSGDAMSTGRGSFGTVLSGVFGYPAPAIVGAALLWSVFSGYTAAALLIGGVVLVLTVLVIRNAFGIVVVLASAGVAALLWFYATPEVQGYALLVLGVALLVGSVRGLFTVIGVHTSRRDQLRTSTSAPACRRRCGSRSSPRSSARASSSPSRATWRWTRSGLRRPRSGARSFLDTQ